MKKLLKKLLRENSTPVSIVDEYFIQEGPEFNCDCCKYFDIESLNSKGGFEHPAYYMIEKMQRYTLKFIKPKQYIYAIARGFGNLSYDDATAHVNWGNVDLATSMKGLTYEEIEVKFKEMGYDGISGLDYRTIKNYIEHRL